MTRSLWYDADGNPITMRQAEALLGSRDRIVAQDNAGALWISTVHLVLDHSLGVAGPPLIYETGAFDRQPYEDGGSMISCWRTPTRHAALAVHDQVCAAARDGVPIHDVLPEHQH